MPNHLTPSSKVPRKCLERYPLSGNAAPQIDRPHTIKSLPHNGRQMTYWDQSLPAFGVRVGARRKTFILIANGGRRIKLGCYPHMKLQQARTLAILRMHGPSTSQNAARASDAVEHYLNTHHAQSRPRTRAEQERLLRKHFLPKVGTRPLDRVTTADIVQITDALKGKPSEQLHVHRALKTFFTWALQRQSIQQSPLANLPPPAKQRDRDRLLSDDEMRAIYQAAQNFGYPFGFIVLIGIHTGLRRNEIGSLKWDYITRHLITIPKELTKNGREHVIPNLINDNLALIPRTSQYLFPTSTGSPFCAWGKNKIRLDNACKIKDFVLHDFRRYLSSTMRRLHVPIDVTEAILNHVGGSRSRVQRIYDRHDRLPEMRHALELYEKHLADLIS